MEKYSKAGQGYPSPTGVFFLPPRHCREIKTLWTSHRPIEVWCRALSQWWQASLKLSVRPWWWGRAARHPQGPISVGVPRKGPSNSPIRRRCNLASTSFTLAPHWSRLIAQLHICSSVFLNSEAKPQSCIFNHWLPIGMGMEMSTTVVCPEQSYWNCNDKE